MEFADISELNIYEILQQNGQKLTPMQKAHLIKMYPYIGIYFLIDERLQKLESENGDRESDLTAVVSELNLLKKELEAAIIHAKTIKKGDQGDTPKVGVDFEQPEDGEDGETPSDERLLALIRPLIPKPEDGKKPTEEELLALIKPLIPQLKNEYIPSLEDINNIITSRLPSLYEIKEQVIKDIEFPPIPSIEVITDTVVARLGDQFDKQISISDISGLETLLNKLNRNIKTIQNAKQSGGGGGGMGNQTTKTFTGDGVTTQFTLDYKVAGSGTGIMVLINGQVQELGYHYSVGSDYKTITFTTAPEQDDAVFVQHVRA